MASYHFSVQIIKRSKGQSVIAAAAYRAGERIRDDRTNQLHDYSRRRGVVHSEILLPPGAAGFLSEREALWNHVERMEGRKDSQLAREINLALPHELDAIQRREMLLNFVGEAFVTRGMVADVAIHAPVLEKGDHEHNHHAHILLTLREATATGLRPVKTREWNSDQQLLKWRTLWADHQNRALVRAGVDARVDHRSLADQKNAAVERGDRRAAATLDRKPEVHVGPKGRHVSGHMPKVKSLKVAKDVSTARDRVHRNLKVIETNRAQAQQRLDLWRRAYLAKLDKPQRAACPNAGLKPPQRAARQKYEPVLPRLPVRISAMLERIGRGMSAWELILAARSSRFSDFQLRYVLRQKPLARQAGRQRLRNFGLPTVPPASPLPFQPIPNLERQDRVGDLARHQYERPVVRQPHDLGGIDEIARRLAHALTQIVTHKITIRM